MARKFAPSSELKCNTHAGFPQFIGSLAIIHRARDDHTTDTESSDRLGSRCRVMAAAANVAL
ncbi:MAG TPA: hypothetical protein VFW28_13125 [Micropepsaceae bacterium]|nr:hypothetical protein [Micropepsaceae bacterium]